MSTAPREDSGFGPFDGRSPSGGGEEISERKARHLEICIDPSRYAVETTETGFSSIRFLHRALPEVDAAAIDTRVSFLGAMVPLPILISCMTGGSTEGNLVNRRLAEAAQRAGLPVGMGSIRILFRDIDYFEQFHMKAFAPDVPVIANLSAVQLRDLENRDVSEMLKRLEVQALAVHLNPGQELFQPNGDRDFRGLREAIARFCEESPVPIIVKETGFGMRPSEVESLLQAGAAYVDLAGAGGTNWVRVESDRVGGDGARTAREFGDWGIPTAVLLGALRALSERPENENRLRGRVIASSGIRSGLDVAKSLALGAHLAGLALPFARAVSAGGVESVLEEIEAIGNGLRAAMALTGCTTLAELRAQRPMVDSRHTEAVAALLAADAPRPPSSHGTPPSASRSRGE